MSFNLKERVISYRTVGKGSSRQRKYLAKMIFIPNTL